MVTFLIILGVISLFLGLFLLAQDEGAGFPTIVLAVLFFVVAGLADTRGYAVDCHPGLVELSAVDRANPEETYIMARNLYDKKLRLYRVPAKNVHFTEKFTSPPIVRLLDGEDGCHAYSIY